MHWFQPTPAVTDSSKAIAASPSGHTGGLRLALLRALGVVLAEAWKWSIPALIFCIAFIPRWSLANSLDIVTDENQYIPTGRMYYTLLTHGLLSNGHWLDNYEAPSLPKLIIGFGSLQASRTPSLNGWLLGARMPGVILGSLLLVLAYWLARPIFGKMPALFGALALALSPWVAYFAAIAYLDGYLLVFVTLAILLTWHAARRPWLLLAVGALLALSWDAKYTGAFAVLPVAGYLAYYYAFVAHRRPPWQLLLVPVVGLVVVYIADPAIWVDPVTRLRNSILFQLQHATDGHNAFWNGTVQDHVPPGEALYILLAKMSLFVSVPALATLVWAFVRLLRARMRPTRQDDRAAFAFFWLAGLLLPLSLLNIIVGTHYVLPLAPAVTFVGAWALLSVAAWAGPRIAAGLSTTVVWLRSRLKAQFAALVEGTVSPRAHGFRFALTRALVATACLGLTLPAAYGLITVRQAEGYTSEWLRSEATSLQVAYPAYADGVQWVTDHTEKRVTVTLVGTKGSLDYWMGTRQNLFPDRIRLRTATPEQVIANSLPKPVSKVEYIVWPTHLIQRQFPVPPDWKNHVVATISGGGTVYCYVLAYPVK